MYSLTKANFFDEIKEKYPDAFKKFMVFVDKYKHEVDWDNLFGGGTVKPPKFHDMPFDLQFGVMLRFFNNQSQVETMSLPTAMAYFERLFMAIEGKVHYAGPALHSGAYKISTEVLRQKLVEEVDDDSDKGNNDGELIKAAAAILSGDNTYWPKHWDIKLKEQIASLSHEERLAYAGALVARELDRIEYAKVIGDDSTN